VVRVASGNFLEMYDFQVFGYYAAAIAQTFFPSGNEFASLMLSLATFGAGFLMRPLGAIVLGAYLDHRGRRDGLLLTLGLMAIGTVSIACTPSYASIGLMAPLLVVAGGWCRGLSRTLERATFCTFVPCFQQFVPRFVSITRSHVLLALNRAANSVTIDHFQGLGGGHLFFSSDKGIF
jgi:MFS family permease